MSDLTQDTEAGSVAHPPATATASTIAPETATATAPPEPSEGPAPATRDDSRSPSPSAEGTEAFPALPTESPPSEVRSPLSLALKRFALARRQTDPTVAPAGGGAAISPSTADAASDNQDDNKFPSFGRRDSMPVSPSATSGGPAALSLQMGNVKLGRRDSLKGSSGPGTPTSPHQEAYVFGDLHQATGTMAITTPPISPATTRRMNSFLTNNLRNSSPGSPGSPRRSLRPPSRQGSTSLSRRNSNASALSKQDSDASGTSRRSSNAAAAAGPDAGQDTAPAPSDRAD